MDDDPERDDAPTGLPEDEPEAPPLGAGEEEDEAAERGEQDAGDAMPGIVSGGGPPDAG